MRGTWFHKASGGRPENECWGTTECADYDPQSTECDDYDLPVQSLRVIGVILPGTVYVLSILAALLF